METTALGPTVVLMFSIKSACCKEMEKRELVVEKGRYNFSYHRHVPSLDTVGCSSDFGGCAYNPVPIAGQISQRGTTEGLKGQSHGPQSRPLADGIWQRVKNGVRGGMQGTASSGKVVKERHWKIRESMNWFLSITELVRTADYKPTYGTVHQPKCDRVYTVWINSV